MHQIVCKTMHVLMHTVMHCFSNILRYHHIHIYIMLLHIPSLWLNIWETGTHSYTYCRFSSSGSSSFASFSSDQSHTAFSTTHSVSASPSTLLAPMTLPPLFRTRSLSSATSSPSSNVAHGSQSKQPSPNDPFLQQQTQPTKKGDDTDYSSSSSNNKVTNV